MIKNFEDICDQVLQNLVLKEDHISNHRVQTMLKAFTYNYLDIDYKESAFSQKLINTISNLQDQCMIFKPGKEKAQAQIQRLKEVSQTG